MNRLDKLRLAVLRATSKALPMLALVTFWLPVLGPLVQPGMITCSHDGALHLLRASHLDTLVWRGVLWPRWLPGMAFGYGYPLFNFHPVLSYYPVLILHRLGSSLLQGWNLSLALSMLVSGLCMYLWARLVTGQRGAFVSAVAYMLAPYHLYDVYWRGSFAESLALPLMPMVMWAALRAAQERRWRYVWIGTLAYAALLLTHSPISLTFTPVLLAYALVLVWGARNRRVVVLQLASMMLLGLGLAAFFLIPAYVERSQVQIWRAIGSGLTFYTYFLTPRELFGLGQAVDPSLINPTLPRSLGLGAYLAAIGVLATAWGRHRVSDMHKRHALWASLTLIGVIVMMLPVSEPIWWRVPFLPFVQFPWRFLGVGSLLVGLLAGTSIAVLDNSASRDRSGAQPQRPPPGIRPTVATGLTVAILAVGVWPWAYPRLCSMPDNPDQAFYVGFEKNIGSVGTTSAGEYLPVAAQEVPTTSPLVKPMRAGQPVVRWDAPGARILQARDDGLSAEIELESDAPVRVVYRAFYFPGWQARLDGQPASLTVVPPFGLMAINVPAGRHALTMRFEDTPPRTIGEIISLITALAIVAMGIFLALRRSRFISASVTMPGQPVCPAASLGLAVLGMMLLLLKLIVVDRYETPLRWSRFLDGQIRGSGRASDVVVAGSMRLLGYEASPEPVPAGDAVYVNLYWAILGKPVEFGATVRVLDEHGLEWSSKNELDTNLGGYPGLPPLRDWPIGMYADDRHAIWVLPGTPPGDYSLVVVPFKPSTLEPLPISTGQPAPSHYPGAALGKLQVASPSRPPSVDALDLAVRADASLGADLALVGYSPDRAEVTPGQTVLLTMGWQARRQPQADCTLRLELVASDGQAVTSVSLPPGGDHYPTSGWTAGQVVRSQVLAHIPGRAQSGQYIWRVTLLDSDGALVGQAMLGQLQITSPPRAFSPPAVPRRIDARLGEAIALIGYDAPKRVAPGQVMSVTLVWQALAETDRDYKVFVHLLGEDGLPIAQSDAVSADWTRPTSGWQAGEFVTDTHMLTLKPDMPTGKYRLVAGMYDTDSGLRLPAADGSEVIELGQIEVSTRQ